jgi:hypothetical protein
MWLNGDTVLRIERRRLDDPKPGEAPARPDPGSNFVELGQRAHWPWIERYVFAPARP